MDQKKYFLINSSKLYREFTKQTSNNCIRRFLAFKVILNCMSFEDLINNRHFSNVRPIRDVFLAHKQENEFFKAFDASELIKGTLIDNLITFMEENSDLSGNSFPELDDQEKKNKLLNLVKSILIKYETDYYSGFRFSNNFLCSEKGQIKEISSSPIASIFYRYNSSKEPSILANYFISNMTGNNDYEFTLINSKIDYILHAVNMCDSIFKDTRNRFSIDGLYEVIDSEQIGDKKYLDLLKEDSSFWDVYGKLRDIRNKLSGHIDRSEDLETLLIQIQELDFDNAFDFVNKLDKTLWHTACSHIAIKTHYMHNMPNAQVINNENIIEIEGIQNTPYF